MKMKFLSGFVVVFAVVALIEARQYQKRDGTATTLSEPHWAQLLKADDTSDFLDQLSDEEFSDLKQDLKDKIMSVEALVEKLINDAGGDMSKLGQDEKKLLQTIGEYAENLEDPDFEEGTLQFIGPCEETYMATDFNQLELRDAAKEAFNQINNCIKKGWRHMEVQVLHEMDLLTREEFLVRLEKFGKTVSEMKVLVPASFRLFQEFFSFDNNDRFKVALFMDYHQHGGSSGETQQNSQTSGDQTQQNTQTGGDQSGATRKRITDVGKSNLRRAEMSLTRMLRRLGNQHE